MQMSIKAKRHYRFLTDISYDYGLINIFVYRERIKFLNNDDEEQSINDKIDENGFLEEMTSETKPENLNSINQPMLFLTAEAGALKSKWDFTIGDPDPFPSIPHAHLQSNKKTKLDCYLGYTYDTKNGNKKLARESRKYINKLWNDIKFREFAINHIDWFIYMNPDYDFRVNNGRRLPRRRY